MLETCQLVKLLSLACQSRFSPIIMSPKHHSGAPLKLMNRLLVALLFVSLCQMGVLLMQQPITRSTLLAGDMSMPASYGKVMRY